MKSKESLRKKLTSSYVLLVMVSLAPLSLVLCWFTYQAQERAALALQAEIMDRAVSELLLTIQQYEAMLRYGANSRDFFSSSPAELLKKFFLPPGEGSPGNDNVILEVSLLNEQGMELARVVGDQVFKTDDLRNMAASGEFLHVSRGGSPYYGPITTNEAGQEQRFTLAVPVGDSSGVFKEVVVATLRLEALWKQIITRPSGGSDLLYVTEPSGRIIAHPDPSMIFHFVSPPPEVEAGLRKGLSGGRVMFSANKFFLGAQQLYIVNETPFSKALVLAWRTITISIVMLILFLLLALAMGIAIVDRVARPIESLARTAAAISDGDFACRASERGYREISTLTESFNSMTALLVGKIVELREVEQELHASYDAMEKKVLARTAELEQANKELEEEIVIRRQAEESLSRYSKIVNSSSDLMSFVNHDYKYLAVNDAYLVAFAKKREQIIGRNVADIYGEQIFNDIIRNKLDRALNGVEIDLGAWLEVGVLGKRYLEMVFSPYWDWADDRKTSGVVVNARDVTERVVLEDNLRQAEKMRAIGTLATGIAHDFNNVLHSIFGCVRIAQKNLSQESDAYKWLEKLMTIGQRAADMIKQIKMFGRQTEANKKPLAPQQLLEEVVRVRRLSLPPNIIVQEKFQVCGRILADPTQLHQVFINLLVNAQYAMEGEGGTLTVELSEVELGVDGAASKLELKPGRYARIVVADTGQGMEREVLDRIFEPFFSTKSFGKGTGLGLAICHGIVTGLGGKIKVTSTLGEGSAFTVYIPLFEAECSVEQATVVVEARPIATIAKGHILYVDDEHMSNEVWGIALRDENFTVTTAESGTEALEIFKKAPQSFDLVISDQRMPGMNGTELAGELIRLRADIPVILITGWYKDLHRLEERHPEIRAVVKKPIEMEELLAAIAAARGDGAAT